MSGKVLMRVDEVDEVDKYSLPISDRYLREEILGQTSQKTQA
jgi:hypothetical protein